MAVGIPLGEAASGGKPKHSDVSGLTVDEIACAEEFQAALHGKPTELAKAIKNLIKVFNHQAHKGKPSY